MNLKEAKTNFFIDTAIDLFMSRSINDVTIKDIALKAGVGEATIYRYFGKKETIVIASVMKLQRFVEASYFNLNQGTTGFEKIKIFYNSYLRLLEERPLFYKFIKEFDAYISGEDPSSLSEYGDEIDKYKYAFIEAYKQGIEEGSIKKQDDIETFYFSTTHSLIELCKKLSAGKIILIQDKRDNSSEEVRCLVSIILNSLKNS